MAYAPGIGARGPVNSGSTSQACTTDTAIDDVTVVVTAARAVTVIGAGVIRPAEAGGGAMRGYSILVSA